MMIDEDMCHWKLTTSRTIVWPSLRTTSIPIGLGAGFAMTLRMAVEAKMMEVVCMMNDGMVLDPWVIAKKQIRFC